MTRCLALALALALALPASAADDLRRVGLVADVGVPDLLQAGVVVRPSPGLRLAFTAGTNAIGPGARVGIALKAPWDVAPALSVDVGGFWPSDATVLISKVAGQPFDHPLLERVGWVWASAHAGLEFGDPRSTFFVHAGFSELHAPVSGLAALVDEGLGASGTTAETAWVRVRGPSARVGVLVWFKRRER